MTQRNRQRSNRTMPKRGNLWLPFSATMTCASGSTISVATLLDRYLADRGAELAVGSTIGPIRGQVSVLADTDTKLNTQLFAAIFLAPEGGVGTSVGLELEQMDAMWYLAAAFTHTDGDGPNSLEYPIQTKAMRKIRSIGEQLHFQVDEIKSTTDLTVTIGGHIFIKLP